MGVGFLVLRERLDPVARLLEVLLFAIGAWSIPYGIALEVTDTGTIKFL